MGESTSIVLDGRAVRDLDSFIAELGAAVGDGVEQSYFGWDLHSLHDCLQGGYLGVPPYEIEVKDAEPMIEAFGHEGMRRYCDAMLRVMESGGRGRVRDGARDWYVRARDAAARGQGETLLDALFDVVRHSPASIRVVSADGEELARAS